MAHVELYSDIIEKKSKEDIDALSNEEIFVRVLDIMDLYASLFRKNYNALQPSDSIEWIDLTFNSLNMNPSITKPFYSKFFF